MEVGAEEHNKFGKVSFSMKKYDDAIKHFSRAINVDPAMKYYQNRAMSYYHLNELEPAELDCRRALALSPNEVKPLYFLGNILLRTNRHNEAISCLSKALYCNDSVMNSASIENSLRRARRLLFEEEENKQLIQDKQIQSYIESLIKIDREKKLDDEKDTKICEQSLKRLNEFVSMASDSRQNRYIPDFFCGKITLELMKDPVITPSGVTYDRDEIVQHLRRIGHFDPLTRKKLTENDIIPNYALKEAIEKFIEENPWTKYESEAD